MKKASPTVSVMKRNDMLIRKVFESNWKEHREIIPVLHPCNCHETLQPDPLKQYDGCGQYFPLNTHPFPSDSDFSRKIAVSWYVPPPAEELQATRDATESDALS
jgi:hypothetical protein